MTSKAEKRRQHKLRVERFRELAGVNTRPEPDEAHTAEILRPTSERLARGMWTTAAPRAPVIDMAEDYIGRLYAEGLIQYHHHEAARHFQAIVAAFMADLPLAGYRSCLAEGFGGYDGGDGNPAAARAYEAMKHKLGAVRFAYLRTETEKPADAKRGSVEWLRRALEAVVK